jgi:cyclophilin family peptidyl-prolyl cis-trans isomerase
MPKIHSTSMRETRRAERARQRRINRIITIVALVVVAAVIITLVVVAINSQKAAALTATQTAVADAQLATQAAAANSQSATQAAQSYHESATQTFAALPTMGGPTPELVGTKQYASAPPMVIDVHKQYFANVTMAKGGQFVIQLYPDKAPITVNSFVFLARNGFFDGVTFHRVLDGFMAQGGDPTGTGSGGPGYQFINEANDLTFDKAGVVAMANAGPNTNGSQFFIMFNAYGLSESNYTIFGQVISGMDVVNGITRRDPQNNPTFTGDGIQSITITEK